MAQPPSFEPRRRRPRPHSAGAQRVGHSDQPSERPGELQQRARRRHIPDVSSQHSIQRSSGANRLRWQDQSSQVPTHQQRQFSSRPKPPASQHYQETSRASRANDTASGQPPSYPPAYRRDSRIPQSFEPRSNTRAELRIGAAENTGSRLDSRSESQPHSQRRPSSSRAYMNTRNIQGSEREYSRGTMLRSTSRARQPSSSDVLTPTRRYTPWVKFFSAVLALWFAVTLGWFGYLYMYGNSKLAHVSALSPGSDTPGTTYLIVGSDERGGIVNDSTEGMRADSIMLLHKPASGHAALISIPRDTYVEIPGYNGNKINASYSFGGPELLTQTVENLTGLTVDHYVQVGMNGVADLTDAVGGVNLCLDYDVNDELSGLVWQAGCHDADGVTALAFSRMRYSDPTGDIGRTQRQRQVVSKILDNAISLDTVLSPSTQKQLVGTGASALTVDESDSLLSLVNAGLSLRSVMKEGSLSGTPPISDLNYQPGGIGSAVLLDPNRIDAFWEKLRDGSLTAQDFNSAS